MKNILWPLLGAMMLNTASAQNNFTLQQCIDYSMKHQSTVLNAAIDEQISKQQVAEFTGIGLPQVNGSLQTQDFLKIPTSLIPAEFFGGAPGEYIPVQFGTKYNSTAGISASQLLFDGSFFVGLQASKTLAGLTIMNTKRTKVDAIESVTKAYYTVLVSRERVKLMTANIDRIKKLLDDTKALNQEGFVEKLDVDRLDVLYTNLLTEKNNVDQLLQLGENLLKFQMGMDQKEKLSLIDSLVQISPAELASSAATLSYSNRVEYNMMQTQLHLYELNLKRYQVSRLPSIAAFGSFSQNAQRNSFDFFDFSKKWFPTSVVGINVSIPVFGGLIKYHQIEESKLTILKTKNSISGFEDAIDLQYAAAKTSFENDLKTLANQKKNIDVATEIYNTTKTKYEEGVGSNLEIINAQTSLKEAQTNYLNALYDALVARVDLQKANGTLLK